jgi:hypothetical protein
MKRFLPVILLYTATLALCVGIVMVPSSCATTATTSSRSTTLHDTLIVLEGVQEVFLAWDAQHQKDIVAQAATPEAGAAALATYQVTRNKIIAAIALALDAIHLASSENDAPSLQAALAAAAQIENDIKGLIGTTSALTPPTTVKAGSAAH